MDYYGLWQIYTNRLFYPKYFLHQVITPLLRDMYRNGALHAIQQLVLFSVGAFCKKKNWKSVLNGFKLKILETLQLPQLTTKKIKQFKIALYTKRHYNRYNFTNW